MEEAKKTWTIYKVYLLIASLVGLVGTIIALGVALTSLGQRIVITNEEYVRGKMSYEFQQCKEPYYYGKTTPADTNRRPSEAQITECEATKKDDIIFTRRVDVKENVLGGGIRAILFAILFFTHYPRFKKESHF